MAGAENDGNKTNPNEEGDNKKGNSVAGAGNGEKNTELPQEEDSLERENMDGYVTPRKTRRPNYIPKEIIFQNITSILNGFEKDRRPIRQYV